MANEDMDGVFLGGGAIAHVIENGEIYLRSDQLGQLLGQTGIKLAMAAIADNDSASAGTAQFLMIVAEKIYELRSELLKRELEAQLPDLGVMDFDEFYKQLSLDIDEDPIDPNSGWMD